MTGDCSVSSFHPEDDVSQPRQLGIDRADPEILISEAFLADADPRFLECAEGLVRMKGCNRTVVYRLGEYDFQRGVWSATLIRDSEAAE